MPSLLFFRSVINSITQNNIEDFNGSEGLSNQTTKLATDIFNDYIRLVPSAAIRLDEFKLMINSDIDFVRSSIIEHYSDWFNNAPNHRKAKYKVPITRNNLLAYIEHIPAMIRSSLRRPSDPKGCTLRDIFINQPSDIARILPPRLPRFKSGERPVGNWVLTELLGLGGYGEVWKGEHPSMKGIAPVALKFCISDESAHYIRHEAALLNRIMELSGQNHGIVRLQQAWLDCEPPCLEYEYVNGGDLCGFMSEWVHAPAERRLQMALKIILRLAQTVGQLHALKPPIVHRDLKPANILVSRKTESKIDFKISDFGIGGLSSHGLSLKSQGQSYFKNIESVALRGSHTPTYASPEQRDGDSPNPTDDVHALGVMTYQLLIGDFYRRPEKSWHTDLLSIGVNIATVDVIKKCLAKKDDRFANANDLAKSLDGLLALKESHNPLLQPISPRELHSIRTSSFNSRPFDPWLTKLPNRPNVTVISPELPNTERSLIPFNEKKSADNFNGYESTHRGKPSLVLFDLPKEQVIPVNEMRSKIKSKKLPTNKSFALPILIMFFTTAIFVLLLAFVLLPQVHETRITSVSVTESTENIDDAIVTNNQKSIANNIRNDVDIDVHPIEASLSIALGNASISSIGAKKVVVFKTPNVRQEFSITGEAKNYETKTFHYDVKKSEQINKPLTLRLEPQKKWLTDLTPLYWNATWSLKESPPRFVNDVHMLVMHPFPDGKIASGTYKTNGAKAFRSVVTVIGQPLTDVQFAVSNKNRIIWQSKYLSNKGDKDYCACNVDDCETITLMTRCKGLHWHSHAIWIDSHFIKTTDYQDDIDKNEGCKYLDGIFKD